MLALLQGHGAHPTARDLGKQDGYGIAPASVWDYARLIGVCK